MEEFGRKMGEIDRKMEEIGRKMGEIGRKAPYRQQVHAQDSHLFVLVQQAHFFEERILRNDLRSI